MVSGRDEIEAQISAFVDGWLDNATVMWGDNFAVGTFALIFEVRFPPDEEGSLGSTDIGWICSDAREWVQAGLFRRALVKTEASEYEPDSDDEDSE